ncbi:glucose-6-phosphate isomerase [Euryarchaeota archaeon ex4484_178]|nr:MAG: glucose-6-phosphate isomerase [Euryarchaeota archaeon ex4484_178]
MLKNRIDFAEAKLEKYADKVVRKASNMRGFYIDSEALERMIEQEDPIIYEVYAVPHENEGELSYAITVLHPGKVGNEYFMTKGHYHSKRDRAELYIALKGRGLLLMQRDNEVQWVEMEKGDIIYVPPYWAHRSINIGDEDFAFLAIYPGDAGHDYGTIAKKGFAKIVVEENGKYTVLDNPKWKE